MLISEFNFFNMEKNHAYIFADIVLKIFLQTLNTQIKQRTSFKAFETFLKRFSFICQYFRDD